MCYGVFFLLFESRNFSQFLTVVRKTFRSGLVNLTKLALVPPNPGDKATSYPGLLKIYKGKALGTRMMTRQLFSGVSQYLFRNDHHINLGKEQRSEQMRDKMLKLTFSLLIPVGHCFPVELQFLEMKEKYGFRSITAFLENFLIPHVLVLHMDSLLYEPSTILFSIKFKTFFFYVGHNYSLIALAKIQVKFKIGTSRSLFYWILSLFLGCGELTKMAFLYLIFAPRSPTVSIQERSSQIWMRDYFHIYLLEITKKKKNKSLTNGLRPLLSIRRFFISGDLPSK